MSKIRAFINARICTSGQEKLQSFFVDLDTGYIVQEPHLNPSNVVDVEHHIVAPAYQELQINGCLGVHFTTFKDPESYTNNLDKVARYLTTKGVGAFYVTLPTVSTDIYRKVLPNLKPRPIPRGADFLGAHCEGPFVNPLKKGAHDPALMQNPAKTSMKSVYGEDEMLSAIKMITLAPEMGGALELIEDLTQRGIVVSLGHTAADYDTGIRALGAGGKMLTHIFNAMNTFSHRSPGAAGLISSSEAPFFSLIADGIHLHPATITMAFRTNRERCILVSDAIELGGLPDGVYPGHAQTPHPQRKKGNKITIEGTDTLIGSCVGIDECVRNLRQWAGCPLAEAARCASENIAALMGDNKRGMIKEGRKADFVVLDDSGQVLQTWIRGEMVYEAPAKGSRHGRQDYRLQLMLLEQQNKQRLLLARKEHDDL